MSEQNSESEAILERITAILEDKRGVSVLESGPWQFEFTGNPDREKTDELATEVSRLLAKENISQGGKEFLQHEFMAIATMGLPTDSIMDLSGIRNWIGIDNPKKFEIDAFLLVIHSIANPEAHDLHGLLKWAQDIESTYFHDDPNEEILEIRQNIERYLKKN